MKKDPFQPCNDEARAQAQGLLRDARTAALGVVLPETGAPHVSRIALAPGPDGRPLSLISDLSLHSRPLRENPRCALLVGEPPARGDAMAFARLSLAARAAFLDEDEKAALRAPYLTAHPKARLYFDFADMRLVRFRLEGAALNGGFGRAFRLSADDLVPHARGASSPS